MSIRFSCACGRSFNYDDSYAGASIECPSCRETQTVPRAGTNTAPASDAGGDAIRGSLLADAGKKWGSPQGKADADYDYGRDDRDPYSRRDFDRRLTREPPPATGGFGGINAGIGGGLAMMAIAIVWFCGGLMFDYIFFYPAILFILGLIAFIKGLSNAGR